MSHAGRVIRQLRTDRGLTQQQLAAMIGCSKPHLSLMESGQRTVNAQWAARIDRALAPDDDSPEHRPVTEAVQWDTMSPTMRQRVHDSQAMVEQMQRALRSDDPLAAMRSIVEQTEANIDAGTTASLTHRIPVINRVAAGVATEFTDLDYPASVADQYITCPDVNDPNAFAARVTGDSMLPDYRDGEIVVFAPNAPLRSGMDCFIRLEPDNEVTFKRVFFDEQQAAGNIDADADNDSHSSSNNGDADAPAETRDSMTAVRLQPLNNAYPPRAVPRAQIAGMYPAVYVMREIAR